MVILKNKVKIEEKRRGVTSDRRENNGGTSYKR